MRPIYLASQSPRRRQLLDQLGIAHELLLPEPHEDAEALEATREGEAPAAYAQRVTLAKLEAAEQRRLRLGLPERRILCADTTVALGERILGK
ncbi:Maf family protein, partial [Pseudorhodoferax sp.]|uniref:Maf family protein n=1 Tax=Pseudorhodoferax sp. TaxID=1993553 RepID=UPI002DD67AA8